MLWKESLGNDGHQFHQYQQNEQSPLTLNSLIQKDHAIGNQVPGLGQTRKYGGAKPVNGVPTLSSG